MRTISRRKAGTPSPAARSIRGTQCQKPTALQAARWAPAYAGVGCRERRPSRSANIAAASLRDRTLLWGHKDASRSAPFSRRYGARKNGRGSSRKPSARPLAHRSVTALLYVTRYNTLEDNMAEPRRKDEDDACAAAGGRVCRELRLSRVPDSRLRKPCAKPDRCAGGKAEPRQRNVTHSSGSKSRLPNSDADKPRVTW